MRMDDDVDVHIGSDGQASSTHSPHSPHGAGAPGAEVSARPERLFSPYQQALRARLPSVEDIKRDAQSRASRRKQVKKIAATTVLSFAAALWIVDPAYHSESLQAPQDRTLKQTLADGSVVELDRGSVLDVTWHLGSRQLHLRNGEGLFHVAHGLRPFSVATHDVVVRDIGTVFDVRRGVHATRVSVLEGAVQVDAAGQKVGLVAKQRVDIPIDGAPLPIASIVDLEGATAWRENKFAFDGLPFADALAEMRPYLRRPVVIDDPRIGTLRLSAIFDRDQADAMVPLLGNVLSVSVRTEPDGSVHFGKRKMR